MQGEPIKGAPSAKQVAAAGAAAAVIIHNVQQRGFVFVSRFRKADGHHWDVHVDYEDGKYDGLVEHARLIKDDYETLKREQDNNRSKGT